MTKINDDSGPDLVPKRLIITVHFVFIFLSILSSPNLVLIPVSVKTGIVIEDATPKILVVHFIALLAGSMSW